ncbi:MAG: class I SAM-dependent methyltransferase [Bdellovibrionales bacterium]|jgi:2-polyprenyl-3-methyl-5-hydroxy-6-metoxy-1,4-benzoquinol methylase
MCNCEAGAIRRDIDALFKNTPWLLRMLATLRPFICPFEEILKEVPAGASTLDIGCGQGLLLNLLAQRKMIASGIGFEANEMTLAIARQTAQEHGLGGLSFVQGMTPDQLPQGPFGLVMMIDVLHHVSVKDQKGLFMAAASRVAKGGCFIYKDMAMRPLWCAWINRLHDLVLARQIIHYVPFEIVQLWAHEAGFKVLRSESLRRLAYAHELLVLENPI